MELPKRLSQQICDLHEHSFPPPHDYTSGDHSKVMRPLGQKRCSLGRFLASLPKSRTSVKLLSRARISRQVTYNPVLGELRSGGWLLSESLSFFNRNSSFALAIRLKSL